MKYFFIEPEVAGKLGENTVLDPTVHPARVDKLHYKFSGWLGDAMLESFPCVIATQAASDALKQSRAGFHLTRRPVDANKSRFAP
ncbi:hypothetical protein ACQVRV_07895 [Ralstonia pseudosolanacearum]